MNLLPQFGFFELIVVAIIALIIVGPQDLPKLMRMAGRTMAQARRMAAEFTSAFDDMAREAEMTELRAEIESLKNDNIFAETKKSIDDAVAPVEKAIREETSGLKEAVEKTVHDTSPDLDSPSGDAK